MYNLIILEYKYSYLILTKKIKLAGQTLDIVVQDHVIITEFGYLSFRDAGIF